MRDRQSATSPDSNTLLLKSDSPYEALRHPKTDALQQVLGPSDAEIAKVPGTTASRTSSHKRRGTWRVNDARVNDAASAAERANDAAAASERVDDASAAKRQRRDPATGGPVANPLLSGGAPTSTHPRIYLSNDTCMCVCVCI